MVNWRWRENSHCLRGQSKHDQYLMKEVVRGNGEEEKAEILRAWD